MLSAVGIRRHRPRLDTGAPELAEDVAPVRGRRSCDRQQQDLAHADAHRASAVRIGATRIDDQRVDAERSSGTSDRPEVLRVVQPFEHRET